MSARNSISMLHIAKLVAADRQSLCLVRTLSPREAVIRSSLPVVPGESVTLTLRSGYDVAAVVSAVQDERIDLVFEAAIPLSTLLAEQQRGRQGLESVRLSISGPVTVDIQDSTYICALQDISLFGAKLRDDAAVLDAGMDVQIHIKGLLKRQAVICWRQGLDAGLRFRSSLGYELLDQWIRQRYDRASTEGGKV